MPGAGPSEYAVVWDFDGTLLDTCERNLRVARRIISTITAMPPEEFPALASAAAFKAAQLQARNWRDLYAREFGLPEALIDRAGALWTDYQRQDATEAPLIDGIHDTLLALAHLPQGIVSQNSRAIIAALLEDRAVHDYFDVIIGYEEVAMSAQKPAPDGLLQCIERLSTFQTGTVFYVGDHEADTVCAVSAHAVLADRGDAVAVVAIAALFDGESADGWATAPGFIARHPSNVRDIVLDHMGGA